MIVKNEELTLENCLGSVQALADEIIIVDTGSTDGTKQVAEKYSAKIYDFNWVDDFSAARNYSFSMASMDYILWLDADDIILPDDIIKFQKLKKNLTHDVDAVMLRYNTGFDAEGNVNFSFFRERLVKRNAGFKWKEPVHEYIETYGKTVKGEPCVTHAKKLKSSDGRNLRIYENQLKSNGQLSPRGTYYYARELKDAGRFREAAQFFESFLNSEKGWVEDNIAACAALSECLTLSDERNKALQFLLKSFEYDTPRPEICCLIGYYFKQQDKFHQAAYWFEQALSANYDSLGFRHEDYMGYIPNIELSVCYFHLGNTQRAIEYNEKAAAYKPDCPAIQNNREFFQS